MVEWECPACNRTLQAEEKSAGKKARCPGCGKIQLVPTPPDQTDKTKHPDWSSSAGQAITSPEPSVPSAAGWRTVRLGLGIVYFSMFISVLGMLVVAIPPMLFLVGRGFLSILSIVPGMLAILAGGLLSFVGECMCCTVPDKAIRKLVVGAVACSSVGPPIYQVLFFAGRALGWPWLAPIGSGLVSLASYILFLFFLRKVAQFFRDDRLGRSVNRSVAFLGGAQILGAIGAVAGVLALLPLIAPFMGGNVDPRHAYLFWVAGPCLIMGIVGYFWFAHLVSRIRGVIPVGAARGAFLPS